MRRMIWLLAGFLAVSAGTARAGVSVHLKDKKVRVVSTVEYRLSR